MKSIKYIGSLLMICAAILFCVTGCVQTDTSPSATSGSAVTTEPPADPAALYENAAQEITNATHLSVTMTRSTCITENSQSFPEESKVSLSYTDFGQNKMVAQASETLIIGTHSAQITDYYSDAAAYTTVNGVGFMCQMSETEFISRYLPVALLDAKLYGAVQSETLADQTIISFSDPTSPEAWACNPAFQLSEASGTATLDQNGHLVSCSYNLLGTYEDITLEVSATVTIQTTSIKTPELPSDLTTYTSIACLDAPRYLEKATGHLLQNKSVSASNTQQIYSQAFMLNRTLETKLDMYQEGTAHNSRRSTTVTSSNTALEEPGSQYLQEELFINGDYTLLVDGNVSEDDTDISAASMHSYCQDLLVSTVLMPQYITEARLEAQGNTITLHFTANDALAHILAEQACNTLYNDPALLSSLATEYETTTMEAYLTLDAVTGLPTGSGLNYSGVHTIDDFSYTLSSQQDQTYDMASKTAKSTIEALTVEAAQPTETTATAPTATK